MRLPHFFLCIQGVIKISNERKAQIFYQGNGSQTQYSFPFDYLRKAFVKVDLISDEKIEELTQGTDYTVTNRVVTLAAPTSLKIKIYRQTTTKPLVGWADASVLRAADMTVQSTQLLHLAEETSDLAQEGGLSKDSTDSIWDARYNKIKNLLDPTDPGDAVTLNYITKNQTSLLTQLNNTGTAQNNSIVSNGDAQNARLIATGDKQNTRLTSTGDTQNKRLTDTGASYVTTMTTLKNTATTKASEASGSAELSKKWAMSSTSPDGVSGNKSSKTWAEEAKTSASNAKTSETNAKTVETTVNEYRTQAANSASAAKTSETNAKSSEVNAKASEEQAKVYTDILKKPVAYLNLLERNTAYSVGDIAYSPNLPSWAYLECTTAGTTGASEPDFSSVKSGVILDGEARFTIRTVCAKEYVDALLNETKKRIRIESGTIEVGEVPKGSGNSQYITFKKPATNAHYSTLISLSNIGNYWADLAIATSLQSVNGFMIWWWNRAIAPISKGLSINWLTIFYDD